VENCLLPDNDEPGAESVVGIGGLSPDCSPIFSALQEIYAKYQNDFTGKVATYIPELAKVDPHLFGVALVSADGQTYEVGDSRHLFTMQSISKPLVYALALEDHGVDYVLTKVGVEPTGEAFNSIVFDERRNRPFNPMVNAGAIATTSLIKGLGHDQRLARLLAKFSDFAARPVQVDRAVYLSERHTGHRNRAIGYLALNFGMVDERVDEHLDLYFEQCSILVSARDLAVMAATLANNGVNPLSGRRAVQGQYVQHVLSVMHSCGMYDYAGEWSYRIGLPAKSGVGGGIIAVLPGQFGIGIFSPLLDEQGNSWRGIRACSELSERFKLHMFGSRSATSVVVRRIFRGDQVRSKRLRNAAEEAILNGRGGAICVFELQGNLFFGSMEQVLRRLTTEAEDSSYMILDLKRVMGVDECACTLLEQVSGMLTTRGKKLLLSYLPDDFALTLRKQSEHEWNAESFYEDTDAALEWCENELIRGDPALAMAENRPVPLASMDIVAGFDAEQLQLLESVLEERCYGAGETIIREGDPADAVYLLAVGLVSVRLRLTDGSKQTRLSTIAAGIAFGELALLDGGRRSADVIADKPAVCYVLPIAKLDALAEGHPEIRTRLVINIGRELSARLRRANAEIRSLAE
jgi:glutaminase